MTALHRLTFYVLRVLDGLWPGWSAPVPPPVEHLSPEAFTFWMGRVYRHGDER